MDQAQPVDSHVHSEWSWDAPAASMRGSCARAVELGLPGIAFTEHLDFTTFAVALDGPYASDHLTSLASPDGQLSPPAFDVVGFMEAIDECRQRFPDLKIFSGLEMGQPHWHPAEFSAVLQAGQFDRVLGSLHCLPDGDQFAEPWLLYPHWDAAALVRAYLADIPRLVASDIAFTVLAHIDYPIRSWPTETAGPFDPTAFEDEFRAALRATADSGRALEINTRIPLHSTILTWWHDEGGDAVTFGSDAHLPDFVGHEFRDAAAMAEAYGFRPGRHPYDLWGRVD
jgi:histidinol-phosphatase (PHP family)